MRIGLIMPEMGESIRRKGDEDGFFMLLLCVKLVKEK